MHATKVMQGPLVAAVVAAGCAGADATGEDIDALGQHRCGPLPAAVEQRFDAMRGPLGCAASATPVSDPPGGCAGTDALLASARREYETLWARGGCRAEPPDLTPLVTRYLDHYAAHHRFAAHRIPREGFTIAAREFGAAHAGTGPLIVLMHGFPDNQHLYDLVAPRLAETQHVVTFDFVGWGDSTKPPAGHVFTFADLRKDLEAVIGHFGATRVVPVVHDASGWPGIDWALDHPDAVATLVLLNTAYHPIPGTAPPNVIRALSALDLRPAFLAAAGTDDLMTRALFRAQVSRFFTHEAPRHTYLPLFEHDIPAASPALFGLTASLLVTARDRLAAVPRMQAYPRPVLIAFGADDPYLNPTVARGFADAFPASQLALIPDAGHYVQLDQPARVAALIEAAVRGH